MVDSLAFDTKLFNKSSFIFLKNQFCVIKFCFGSSSKFLGLIDFSHFFTEENFDSQCELFTGYNLSVRKLKDFQLNNFVSNGKESTTFSINTGPDFGGSCWICY